jgi:nucleotide-binding universal stress UspA family protein
MQQGERSTRVAVSDEMRAVPNYQKILVATDGSACSLRAGEHAVYLSGRLGAELIALNVINKGWAYHTGVHYRDALVELEKSGQADTEAIEALAEKDGIRCERMVVGGYKPHQVIIEIAEREGVDCIVVGSTGRSAFERLLIGSQSEKVVRYAKCPVLLVH